MIRDAARWRAFEHEFTSTEKLDFAGNLRLIDSMYDYACKLGRFSAENALDGIEKNIHLAAVLHRVRRTS
jgi:hypothetical protein